MDPVADGGGGADERPGGERDAAADGRPVGQDGAQRLILEDSSADVRVGGRIFEGQTLGAVLADRASVGGGVTFAPGTLVGAAATVGHGVHVTGSVPNGAEVVR